MNYAPGTQISKARHIARSAQQRIRSKTGMTVSLMLYPIAYAACNSTGAGYES